MSDMVELEINRKYTFWKLLSEYRIEIPIIQRDYAQGRKSETVTSIRMELLKNIHKALLEGISINFDFVYGTIEGDKLLPLDGQQRLTTFFLLHWYLAQKERRMDVARDILARFSYTTRISSRDFCDMLLDVKYVPTEGEKVSDYIKNENRYFKAWNSDPTIRHMLVMLDDIHKQFYGSGELFDKLTSEKEELLTFNFLPMEHYALTDDLYIKMNARGKALTVFENFKAKFLQHLKEKGLPYDHFEKCIDGAWTDFLWDFRESNNTIDNQFMNYFCFVTEMLYLEKEEQQDGDSPFRPNRIRELIDYYQTKEDVGFLYEYLDLWAKRDEASFILSNLFSQTREDGKVRLFEGHVDLLSTVVNGENMPLTNKLLLFAIMKRYKELGKEADIDDFRDYARLIRNYLLNTRAFVRKKCSYTPDLRFGRHAIPIVQDLINVLCGEKNVYEVFIQTDFKNLNGEIVANEKEKAQLVQDKPELKRVICDLEDLSCFRSAIFNVIPYIKNICKQSVASDLEGLFSTQEVDLQVKRLQALLSVWDYGIRIGGSVFGDRYFYGYLENLYAILTYDGGNNYKKFVSEFISQYENVFTGSIEEALNEIIRANLEKIDKNDWRYTIVKYTYAIKNNDHIGSRSVVFAKEVCLNGYIIPHKINGLILTGYHAIPEFMETYYRRMHFCTEDYYAYAGNDPGYLRLSFAKEVRIGFNDLGELLILSDDAEKEAWINDAFNEYLATDLSKLDRVERCVALVDLLRRHEVMK